MLEPNAGPTFTPWAAYYPPMDAILMYSLGYIDKNTPNEGVVTNEIWYGPPSMWEFQYGQWTNITSEIKGTWPLPYGGLVSFVYDPPTKSIIFLACLGSVPGAHPIINKCDAWAFRNLEWTFLGAAPILNPYCGYCDHRVAEGYSEYEYGWITPDPSLFGLTYDPQLQGLITVGAPQGNNKTTGLPMGNDTTWGIINNTWVNLTGRLGTEPPYYEFIAQQMAYDPGSGCVVSISLGQAVARKNFTGATGAVQTWQLCQGNWSRVSTNATLPEGVTGVAMPLAGPFIYDPQLGGDLYWGGSNDSWLLTNGSWNPVHWSGPVPPSTMSTNGTWMMDALVYDPSESYLFLMGGASFSGGLDDAHLPWTAHLAYGFGQLPPFLTLTTDPTVGEVGADLTVTASVTGGVLPFTFEYSGLPPGCQSANQSQIECQPTVTGNYTVGATLVDGLGRVARASISIWVGPPPTVALEVSKSVTDVGRSVELRLVVSEGTPPYLYGYTGLPFGCTSENAAVVNCTPEETGVYSVVGAVTDAEGSVRSASVNLTVNSDPSVRLTSSRGSLDEGQTVGLKAAVVGGTGPFDWSYEGLPPGCRSVDAANLTCRPTAPGSYRVEVVVNDSVGVEVRRSVTFGVWPPLTVELGRVGPKAAEIGQTVEWRVGITGGLGPYTTQAEGLEGAVASGGNVSWTATGIGNYTLTVVVTDSNGQVAIGAANLTVVRGVTPPPAGSDGVWAAMGLGVAGLTAAVIWVVQRRRP